jgi:hypothetical protein
MFLDENTIFSDKQSLAEAAVGDTASSKAVDQGEAGDAIQHALWLVVALSAKVTSAGAATLQARLETADDEAFTMNKTVLWQSEAIALAKLLAGYSFGKLRLPLGTRRYLRVVYTVGTAALTGGAVNAFLTPSVDHQR